MWIVRLDARFYNGIMGGYSIAMHPLEHSLNDFASMIWSWMYWRLPIVHFTVNHYEGTVCFPSIFLSLEKQCWMHTYYTFRLQNVMKFMNLCLHHICWLVDHVTPCFIFICNHILVDFRSGGKISTYPVYSSCLWPWDLVLMDLDGSWARGIVSQTSISPR